MKRPIVIIILLAALLIGTNSWLIYSTLDQAVTIDHVTSSLDYHQQALQQILSITELLAQGIDTKEEVLSHLKRNFNSDDGFEKEGYLWIGSIGIQFDERGKLRKIRPAWD